MKTAKHLLFFMATLQFSYAIHLANFYANKMVCQHFQYCKSQLQPEMLLEML